MYRTVTHYKIYVHMFYIFYMFNIFRVEFRLKILIDLSELYFCSIEMTLSIHKRETGLLVVSRDLHVINRTHYEHPSFMYM